MDWNLLKLFLAVQETRSLGAAAKALGISHTTAFRHLNALEEQLGARLFDRLQGRYQLTDLGEETLAFARPAAHAFEELERRVMGRDRSPRGTVRLTAPASFASHLLPLHLERMAQDYPDIDVELLVTNQPLEMNDRAADIALRVADAPPGHLVGRRLRSIGWSAYAGKPYLARAGRPLAGGIAGAHHFIGAAGQLARHAAFEWMEHRYKDRVAQRCDDLMAMAGFARAGLGIAVVPDDIGMPDLVRCFSVPEAGRNSLWILTHPDLRKVERIRIVMRFLAEALKSDPRLPEDGG